MQVDNTNVTVDRSEDPFKDFGTSIVGNIVDYSSSSDEEEDQEPKKEDAPSAKKAESSIGVATSSVSLAGAATTPSTPPTQAAVVIVAAVQPDEEDEAQIFISSLSKFFEKKKSAKSIEKALTSVLDRMEKTVSPVDTPADIQQWATILCKAFDNEFTTLTDVVSIQVQMEHDGKILNTTMCTNMRNDIETVNVCIKALR